VQTLLAARFVLEMLHGIGEPDLPAVEPCLRHGAVQDLAGRPDEGMAREVLLIARLLAHQHQRRPRRPLAEHCLRGMAVERTERA
jgi:hypothetical protein